MRPMSAHNSLRGPPLNLCDIMQRGYLPQVPLLVNLGADLEIRDATGRTPLMLAAYVQPEEWGVGVARLLIEVGVKMSHRDRHGMNALHHACVYERLKLVKVLLNALDFNLGQQDKFGNTALHYAAMSGNVDLVRLMATYHRRYRITISRHNRQSRTARDEALKVGSQDCADLLNENFHLPSGKGEGSHKRSMIFSAASENSIAVTSEDGSKIVVTGEERKSPSIMNEDAKSVTMNEDSKSPAMMTEDVKSSEIMEDEGGFYPRLKSSPWQHHDGAGTGKEIKELVNSHQSLLSSEGLQRSSENVGRIRRSGVRRPFHASARPSSSGSSNSSKSGASARKQSLLSGRSASNINNNSILEQLYVQTQNSSPGGSSGRVASGRSDSGRQRGQLRDRESLKPTSPAQQQQQQPARRKEGGVRTALADMAQFSPQLSRSGSRTMLKDVGGLGPRSSSSVLLLPYEKDPERVIHVAPESDFRNSPEYVVKLTRMDVGRLQTDSLPSLVLQPPPPPPPKPSGFEDDASVQHNNAGSWRDNFRFLFHHLEFQCSPSWRNAAKTPADSTLLSPHFGSSSTHGDEGDDSSKEKKTRRPSSSQRPASQMNDASASSSSLRRRPPSNRQRKVSAAQGTTPGAPRTPGADRSHSDQGSDGAGTSTTDSTSGVQIQRKRSETRPDQQGSNSSSASQRNSPKAYAENGRGSGPDSGSGVNRNANLDNVDTSNGGSSLEQGNARRTEASTSHNVPSLTETLVNEDAADDQTGSPEPVEIDNNRLSVLSED